MSAIERIFTVDDVRLIVMYAQLEGCPGTIETIDALTEKGKLPVRTAIATGPDDDAAWTLPGATENAAAPARRRDV